MDTLIRGTKILMNGRSDEITLIYKIVETGEVVEINSYYDDYDKIFKGRETKELGGSVEYPSLEAVIVDDIPILDDYEDTDCRLIYKQGKITYITERITELHIHNKMELNRDVKDTLPEYLDELGKKADINKIFDSVTEDEKTCIVITEDGLEYFFDIL